LKKGKKAAEISKIFFFGQDIFDFFCLFAGLFAKKKEGEAKQKWVSSCARA
jgi:hypothetical protein